MAAIYPSVREYRDELIKNSLKVFYFSIEDPEFQNPYEDKLLEVIKKEKISWNTLRKIKI